jgi:hypothetical protein
MRGALFSVLLVTLPAPVSAQLKALVVFGQWGAFEKIEPRTCYAIARPYRAPRELDWKPFAAVSWWPTRKVRSQVHFRLSREKRQGSAVLLKIDGQTFQLRGGGIDAWAPDARADAAIVAAMRGGVEMRVETRAPNGARVRDVYQLRGAATAIDAAAVACSK